jgi:hypothetical protein
MFVKKTYWLTALTLVASPVQAGDINPPASPHETQSYTLQDICNRLENGTPGSKSSFSGPTSSPGEAATCTIDKIMQLLPAVENDKGAKPENVETDLKYWGLANGHWGVQTGTGKVGGGGVDCPTDASRFTDNNDGTVTDNCTKLIWLKDANCLGQYDWPSAKSRAQNLAAGTCGLRDNSKAGDWHLPTVRELQSLIDYSQYGPALPSGYPFSGVQTNHYWSSAENASRSGYAWGVYLDDGVVDTYDESNAYYVWPVRHRQ